MLEIVVGGTDLALELPRNTSLTKNSLCHAPCLVRVSGGGCVVSNCYIVHDEVCANLDSPAWL